MCKTKAIHEEIGPAKKKFLGKCQDYGKSLYVTFWHDLAMDPQVRRSPYHDPPENEVFLPESQKVRIRTYRVGFLLGHILCVYALYLIFTGQVHKYTLLMAFAVLNAAKIGITVGAHRLWSHNAYKATWPLRIFLVICQSFSFELSAYNWAKIHRVHHKHCDSDGDPVNAGRGFFFSHCGWMLITEHPDVTRNFETIWMEDLKKDKILMFQNRYIPYFIIVFAYAIPVFVPWYFWNESLLNSHLVPFILTTTVSKHITFTVNSVAHLYGMKPYNRNITSRNTNPFVALMINGEGWHNFHHVFPWDYRNSEFVEYASNIGALFIDVCAYLGLAYNMKTVSEKEIIRRVENHGDGSHCLWGWNDKDNTPQNRAGTEIRYRRTEETAEDHGEEFTHKLGKEM